MIKYLLLKFSLFAFLPCFCQVTANVKWLQHSPALKSDTIYYNRNKKLVWSDFNGKPDKKSDATAITSSGFGYLANMQTKEGKTGIEILVYCYFSKTNSWVKTESSYALTHEQHHFDVTYIITNLFIKKLKEVKFTRNNYAELIDKAYYESCRDLEKMQNEYDGQTKNGRLKNIQWQWDEKIEKQLGLLK